jgi:hypothetical protein
MRHNPPPCFPDQSHATIVIRLPYAATYLIDGSATIPSQSLSVISDPENSDGRSIQETVDSRFMVRVSARNPHPRQSSSAGQDTAGSLEGGEPDFRPADVTLAPSIDWRLWFAREPFDDEPPPIDDERAQFLHDLYRDEEAV